MDFNQFGLPEVLNTSLAEMGFSEPTPVQAQVIPVAMQGHDVLASAQTGSGKTGAFAIPLVAKIITNPRTSALVLTPTRELAVQVITVIHQLLGKKSPVKTALLIGGEAMPKQFDQLKARPSIIVGTPGRINDHLTRGTLMLHNTELLVLDEADRMLDMGFGIQLDEIAKYLTKKRQTLMFSATFSPQIIKVSQKYLENPERIAVGSTNVAAKNIKQEVVQTTEATKYDDLIAQLEAREGSKIIFVKTKFGADKLATRLYKQNNLNAVAIHGDLQQRKRDRVIIAFRNKRYDILVATDVAARGLDIPHIEHVINYDLPQCPEDYIHRIGRTARAGAEGAALSLVTKADGKKWYLITRLMNPDAAAERPERGDRQGGENQKRGGGHRKGNSGKPFNKRRSDQEGRQNREFRQDREPRENREFRQERKPREDREFRQDRKPRQDGEFRQNRKPRQDGEFRQDRKPRQDGEFRQDRKPRQDGEFRQDRKPRQDGEFRQDRKPRQDGEFRQDRKPRQDGEFRQERGQREDRKRSFGDKPVRGDRNDKKGGQQERRKHGRPDKAGKKSGGKLKQFFSFKRPNNDGTGKKKAS